MNSMYKDFVREGTMKKSSSSSTKTPPPPPPPEIKAEAPRNNDDVDGAGLEQKPSNNSLKRTATEAFAVGDEIIKLETHEEITVANEVIKDEIYETVSKVDVTTTLNTETDSYSSESKKLKSEVFDEDENSITIIDISESTVTRMDSSFDSAKADSELKHKMDGASKVGYLFLSSEYIY